LRRRKERLVPCEKRCKISAKGAGKALLRLTQSDAGWLENLILMSQLASYLRFGLLLKLEEAKGLD
jgi:hypothetical protein